MDTIFTDTIRPFPIVSIRNHQYIFMMYVCDCNTIITTSIRTRTEDDLMTIFCELYNIINAREFKSIF